MLAVASSVRHDFPSVKFEISLRHRLQSGKNREALLGGNERLCYYVNRVKCSQVLVWILLREMLAA